MATFESQFAYKHSRAAVLKPGTASDRAADYAKSNFANPVFERHLRQNINPGKSTGKFTSVSKSIFTLLIWLILLSSRQVYACCDGNLTDDEPVLNLATAALAANPEAAAAAAQKDIKSDAVATLAITSQSHFVKISNSGEILADDHAAWECVIDKNNSLTWEVKKSDGGIRDKDNSYSWLRGINGKHKGVRNGGRCEGSINCDTSSYVHAINEHKLCGYTDWRLPTREELETLVEYNSNPKEATINNTYFPEAVPSWYWTASENSQSENYAWYVLFRNGIALNDLKERPKHIRLVRGNQTQ